MSNCAADGQGNKWEELEEDEDAEASLADVIPTLDSESNSDVTMALTELQHNTAPVSIVPIIQDLNVANKVVANCNLGFMYYV